MTCVQCFYFSKGKCTAAPPQQDKEGHWVDPSVDDLRRECRFFITVFDMSIKRAKK